MVIARWARGSSRKRATCSFLVTPQIQCKFCILLYFLIAPKVMPLIRCFLKIMVKTIAGSKNMKVPAAAAPQSYPSTPIW